MKNYLLILLFIIPSFAINAQQSKGWSQRPANVSKGKANSSKAQVLISGVPSYIWQHGCAPTALGMVVGYYDGNGFPDLISGSATTQTTVVDDAMANTQHYNDYSLPKDYSGTNPSPLQDKSELGGAHASNCLADFIKTSFSSEGNYYGWSYSSKIDDGFINYASQQNSAYQIVASYNYFNASSWTDYKIEIDNNRPVVLLVDTDGDGGTDHFVTGIGYDDSNDNYAIYDTWDNSIHWYPWHAMSSIAWGIYGFNKFVVTDLSPINENSQNIDISIYPNPVSNTIKINSKSHLVSYNIYSLNGKELLSGTKKEVNIENFENGIYFINIITREGNKTLKFVKE